MLFSRTREDELPFATEGSFGTEMSRLAGGETLANVVDAGVKNRFRKRIEQWASSRGFPIVDSHITVTSEGATARVPLYAITGQVAFVRGMAVQPMTMTLSIEPTTWTERLKSRFAKEIFTTDDESFDRGWRVKTTNARAAHHLLGGETRELVRDVGCWCRVTYTNGDVEIALDDAQLAGVHVLGGVELVLHLTHARLNTGAYR